MTVNQQSAEYESSFGRALVAAVGQDLTHLMSKDVIFAKSDDLRVGKGIFDWQDLNALLGRGSVQPAELILSNKGVVVDPSEYLRRRGPSELIDLRRLLHLIDSGCSVIIDGLDRADYAVRSATNDVVRITGEAASCNLFATFKSSQAFHSHFDEVDTIIVQVEGSKHWQVHGPSEPDPLPEYGDSDPARCPDVVLFDRVLEPGDILHVPRGWWHTVRGAGDKSLHLTFAFTRKTNFDWLKWALYKSLSEPLIRANLDRSPSTYVEDKERLVATFMEYLQSVSFADFLKEERIAQSGWLSTSLPWSVMDDQVPEGARVSLVPIEVPFTEEDEQNVIVMIANEAIKMPLAYKALLDVIFERRSLRVDDLASLTNVPPYLTSQFVLALVRQQLLRLD